MDGPRRLQTVDSSDAWTATVSRCGVLWQSTLEVAACTHAARDQTLEVIRRLQKRVKGRDHATAGLFESAGALFGGHRVPYTRLSAPSLRRARSAEQAGGRLMAAHRETISSPTEKIHSLSAGPGGSISEAPPLPDMCTWGAPSTLTKRKNYF